jgi:hypothetical protein
MKEKPLTDARLYLSGPIEHSTDSFNWRTEPTKVLTERFKVDLFDPFSDPKQQWLPALKEARDRKDFAEMSRIARSFVRKDLGKVDRSDILIAYLPYKVATTGTHHEIITSVNSKKPTLLVCPQGVEFIPLWYFGIVPTEVMFGSWEALYDYLDSVNRGEQVHNNRWAFVYGLV